MRCTWRRRPFREIHAESDEILTNTIVIQFFPEQLGDLQKNQSREMTAK